MNIETFNWAIDANHDGAISFPEIWATVGWLYQLPGNLLVEALGHMPQIADIFHISASADAGYASLYSWFTAAFSLFFWLFVLLEACNLKTLLQARLEHHARGKARLHWHWPGF